MKTVFLVGILAISANTWAAEYPNDMLGNWIDLKNNQQNACQNPQLVVEKKLRYNEFDVECVPTSIKAQKVSDTITKYIANEQCQREDSKWQQTTIFSPGGLMLVTEKRDGIPEDNVLRLKKCQ